MDEPRCNGDVAHISERLEKSLSMDSDDKLETYNRLVQEAKDVARQGNMNKALDLFKKAYSIRQSEKLKTRIQKIEKFLAENESENDDEEFVDVNGSGLLLFKDLHDKLYDYQKQGVAFLYSLYRDGRKGGILADDMGLGKTIQVISFLSGMYDAELVKTTMLVVPTSLITNWTKEFAKWTPGMRVKEFHGTSKAERTRNLERVQRRGGVLITTYNMLHNNWQILASYEGKEFSWDYMILDEAHKIKTTTTKTAKSATAIPSKHRVLLTGTPVQNNLKEMWALFDFACQGTLLGTAKTFKSEYENPITRAREKDATPGEKALGSRMSENLMAIIMPYFLRRTKAEVQKRQSNGLTEQNKEENSGSAKSQGQNEAKSSGAVMPTLTRKNDLIVWTYLSAVQEDIYRQFISLDHIKELLMTTKSPLAQLTILKKLCDHPRLLSAGAMAKLGLDENEADSEGDTHDISNVPDDTLISESGKMVFLFALLERLREEGHRVLVFAHYRKVLDIIERILNNRGFKVMRMDGTITHTAERERRITLFQKDQSYTVFLLTTQVGGVGITLTAANRVVIYDPSWNPATDAQAVDRAYRIGQTENVVIYRLITCGTVEEKIYRRQVFKDSLIRQNTGDKKNPFRYFSKQELKELFTLEDTRSSTTQLQLQALHSKQRRTDPELDEHIAHLHAMEMFGISDHDLMFSVNVNHEEAPEDQEEYRYIEGRVQKAQELMKAESELQMQLAESMASSTEAAWLRQPENNQQRERSHERKPKNPTPSPPVSSYYGSPGIVDLDLSSSRKENDIKNRNKVIDLTVDESSSEGVIETSQEFEKPKPVKQERSYFEENLNNHVSLVISDDEMQENAAQQTQEADYMKENGDCSMNNLVIEDSLEEVMEISAQKQDLDPESVRERTHLDNAENTIEKAGDYSMSEVINDSVAMAGEMADTSVKESVKANCQVPDQSHADSSLVYFTADDNESPQLNSSKPVSKKDLGACHITPLKHKRLSILQTSHLSFRDKDSSKVSTEMESLEGDFNLQLEDDSDMFSDQDILKDHETEAEEKELLSKLQLEGSFDVDKSLTEQQHKEKSILNNVSDVNASANDSIIATTRKKRVARIYDSEDEEEEMVNGNDREIETSFHMLGASTPKSAPTPNRSRKSIGGNTSVASRRSFVLSLIDDMENQDASEENGEKSGSDSEAEEVDTGLTREESETEPSGETLNTEGEEEESLDLEESTGDPELSSNEQMDQFTANPEANNVQEGSENNCYDSLVQKGREFYSKGKLEDALGFFLRAIDIKPGDPEIQLMTIQLYRQLSHKR